MLRIRLRRVGKKKQPMYRIVVADSRSPRDGDFVDAIGTYHPLNNPSTIVLDQERAKMWLERGAQPSDRVAKILSIQGVAEIPRKLATRIALGEQRAKDAAVAAREKAKAEAEAAKPAEAPAEAKAPVAAEAAAPAEAPAEAEAAAVEEAPVAEEAPAAEEPAADATAEEPAEG
jgi:small subunit ribosomal protein S16